MWKKMFVTLLSFVVVLILGLFLLNGVILRSDSPALLKTIVTLIMPPDDLYKPLASQLVEVRDGSFTTRLSYNNRYLGSHELSLILGDTKELSLENNSQIALTGKVECLVNGERRYVHPVTDGHLFFGRHGSGYSFGNFNVPRDLPLDQTVVCTVTVSEFNSEFLIRHGPIQVVVKKTSDL